MEHILLLPLDRTFFYPLKTTGDYDCKHVCSVVATTSFYFKHQAWTGITKYTCKKVSYLCHVVLNLFFFLLFIFHAFFYSEITINKTIPTAYMRSCISAGLSFILYFQRISDYTVAMLGEIIITGVNGNTGGMKANMNFCMDAFFFLKIKIKIEGHIFSHNKKVSQPLLSQSIPVQMQRMERNWKT